MENPRNVPADMPPARDPKAYATEEESFADKARRKLSDAADHTGKAARDATSAVVENAQDATDQVVSGVKQTAAEAAKHGKSWTTNTVRSIGRAIDAGSHSLEQDGMTATAGYVRSAAKGLMEAADGVNEFNPSHLTNRAEQFVRDRPMVSVAALALVGFAVASILRSDRG